MGRCILLISWKVGFVELWEVCLCRLCLQNILLFVLASHSFVAKNVSATSKMSKQEMAKLLKNLGKVR